MKVRNQLYLLGAICVALSIFLIACDMVEGQLNHARADRFFSELPRAEISREDALNVKNETQLFRINGEVSSRDWLSILDDGTFDAEGFLVHIDGSVSSISTLIAPMALFVPETVSGLTVFHVVPLIVTEETRGETVFEIDGDTVTVMVPSNYHCSNLYLGGHTFHTQYPLGDHQKELKRVNFSLQAGWLHAEEITLVADRFFEGSEWLSDFVFERYLTDIYFDRQKEIDDSDFWLDVSEGETIRLVGYSGSESRGYIVMGDYFYEDGGLDRLYPVVDGAYSTADVTIVGNLGGAAIYHVARAHYTDRDLIPVYHWEEYEWWHTDIDLKVRLEDNRLVIVE